MTICPIAIFSGCKKCPAFKFCPLKSVLGDYVPEAEQKAGTNARVAKTPTRAQRRRK